MKLARQVCILFVVTLSVSATSCSRKTAVNQAVPKAAMAQETALRGDPGCHYTGGCPDGPEKCKFCDKNGDCRCSDCCIAEQEKKKAELTNKAKAASSPN